MRTAPDYIQFYPTLRCNRSCAFCFNHAMPFMPDMKLSDIMVMLDTLVALKVRTVDILGGEPTLHSDLQSIVRAAKQRGLAVNISTNGTNIPVLEELIRSEEQVTIGLSVNDQETLDRLQGFISQHHPVVKTVAGSVIDQSLVNKIRSLGPAKFYLIYQDAVTSKELHATMPFPRFLAETTGADTVYCSGFLPDRGTYPELSTVRCPAGTTKLGIMPDGSVYPCNLFFGKEKYRLGNILHDSFHDIWSHPGLEFFRTFQGNSCSQKTCNLHRDCHGGCPAQSFLIVGDPAAPDPRCMRGRF